MGRKAAEMSALQVSRLRKPGLHAVGGVDGLALQITPSGARSWILRATIGGKRRDMGLGGFPDVTLAGARESARVARQKIREGIDPIDEARAQRSALAASRAKDVTFEKCALDYIASKEPGWHGGKSSAQWRSSLTVHVFPKIGSLLVRHVGDSQVLDVLRPIWTTKTETATRIRGRIEKILDSATVSKLRDGPNPARWTGHLEHMLAEPAAVATEEHFAALSYRDLGSFIERLKDIEGNGARCLHFAILTAMRSGAVRGVSRSEVDFDHRLWIVPAERMKGPKGKRKEHRVPLSKAAIELLKAQPSIDGTNLFFPGDKNRPLSDATLMAVLKRMKVEATVHGFRSTFKDWAVEQTSYPNEMSELALAHTVGDKVEQAYRRADMFEKRLQMMEDWAAFCGRKWQPAKTGKVLPLKAA